ncbi:MAG TPA: hypothetical protein VFF06_13995 [Polyangia bacterium]|nr:hypothetical protein [Polyangia bacterium]
MTRERFAPGKSPFHLKGVVYRGVIEYVERTLAGGRGQLAAALRDEPLRSFFAQPFLDGSWYDALPLEALCQAIAQLERRPMLELVRDLSRAQVRRDTRGVYKLLLKLVSPETVLERAPRAAQQYFDFVTSTSDRLDERRFRLTGSGIPDFLAPVYMAMTESFLLHALELAGAREPVHRWLEPRPAGERHGVPLVKVEREIVWR